MHTPSRRPYRLTVFLAGGVIFFATALANAQNTISTIAGGGTLPPFSTSATGSYADIPGPASVAADSQGNVYVASQDANQVYKISSGVMTVFAGEGWPAENPVKYSGMLATQQYLNGPQGVAVDQFGDVFIADTDAFLVREVKTDGTMVILAGTGDQCQDPTGACGDYNKATLAPLSYPYAVATDSAGNVYIADSADNKIRIVNMQSTPIQLYGLTMQLQPGYIATVAGNGVTCVKPPCGDGGPATKAQLNFPQGVFVDKLGNILIADTGDHRVRGVLPSGEIGPYAGNGTTCSSGTCGDGGPAASAQIGTPWQLYVDSSENLYITDSLAQRIRKVTPGKTPMISDFAGNANGVSCTGKYTPPATATFCGDTGPITSALLNHPQGVTADNLGNIYIGDTGDQRIRIITAGDINTFAGGGLSDGPALSAIFGDNEDVAVDASGNLYIADTGNNRIRKLSGGMVTTLVGSGVDNYYGNNNTPAVYANLSQPAGLALDSAGNIYIADTYNYAIRVLNTQSSKITIAGVVIGPQELGTIAGVPQSSCPKGSTCYTQNEPARSALIGLPKGIALDASGNVYFADEAAAVISEITTQGNIQTVAGNFWSVCTMPTNFAACGDGQPATSAAVMLAMPYSVAVDGAGNIFISDAGDNRVRVVNTSGIINAYAFNGEYNVFGPNGQAALSNGYIFPQYIALDARDNMFVSGSSLYYVIQRIDASNNPALLNPVWSIAGWPASPKYYGYCDSNCASNNGNNAYGAFLNNAGVAVDSAENLYISDAGNNRIRLVSSSPTQGLAPTVKVSPGLLNFGSVPVGMTSGSMSFNVTNTGDDDLVMGTPSITGPFNFVSQAPCYGNIIPPDTTCQYSVTFTPTQMGVQKGQATVNDNAFGSPSQMVNLTGTGT